MGKVVEQAIMSLGGYVAKPDNSIGRLFMGEGNRAFFGRLTTADVLLGNPTSDRPTASRPWSFRSSADSF